MLAMSGVGWFGLGILGFIILVALAFWDAAQRAYIQNAADAAPTTADELARLADLKSQGVLSDAEFEQAKAKAIA
jgi:hypothetical protein